MKPGEFDRRLLRRRHETLASDVSLIASEFLGGFQTVQKIDRPAVSIFGSARVGEQTSLYRLARETGALFAADDFAKADVELARGGMLTTLDVAHGGGNYLRIGATGDGRLSVAHYNGQGAKADNGIWVHRDTPAGWVRQLITPTRIGEQLGFDVATSGLHGVAFYDVDQKRLAYLESADADVWTDPEYVDTDGDTGRYPSLAFDGNGEPAIAYYRCNDYSPKTTNCDQNKDGLYLARRVQGAWVKQKIAADGVSADGMYPAITFVGGKVLIAFQKKTLDPSSNVTKSELYLAQEP